MGSRGTGDVEFALYRQQQRKLLLCLMCRSRSGIFEILSYAVQNQTIIVSVVCVNYGLNGCHISVSDWRLNFGVPTYDCAYPVFQVPSVWTSAIPTCAGARLASPGGTAKTT